MSEDKSCQKSCQDLGFQSSIRYESDLLNGVLYALVGQEAAKISEVKVGGQFEIVDSARFETNAAGARLIWQIFF